MMKQPSPLSDPDANKSNPWRTEGLFSTHFLVQRFAQSGSAHWPGESESNEAFDRISVLLSKNEYGLRKGNEEDCEDRFISPVLDILGFAYANRKIIPEADRRALPDYLLYGSQESVDAAFHAGRRESYYIDCLGLLEAKRWAHNLSEDASGRGKAAKGRSPHHQIRDYLSDTDRLVWGILTNGEKWRLYCKHDRASSFFEFDLRSAVVHNGSSDDESRARSQFRFFFGLFRAAMFSREPSGACPLDELRSGAERFRADVEARLRTQVFDCVELLGKGLLDSELNSLTKDDLPAIYENSLILLYRILFVLNAEARDLLPTHESNERARTYFHSYGLEWVRRKLSDPGNAEYADNGTFTLYERLRALFTLINGKPPAPGKRDKNEELDIPRYNGGLFDPSRYPFLEQHKVGDSYLAGVLRLLSFRRGSDGETTAFDYASLGERHLGSIYEGLLEHHLAASESGEIALRNDRGERKNQGAYYTPADWVNYIVEHTLTPLLERIDNTQVASQQEPNESAPQPVIPNSPQPVIPNSPTVRNPATQAESDHRPNESAPQPVIPNSPTVRNPAPLENEEREPDDSFANAVLNLNICDPAMGSAHFLVEATAFLAEAIAAHPTTAPRPEITTDGKPRLKSDGSGDPLCTQEAKLAYWKRRVVEACIYGVDLNPLASSWASSPSGSRPWTACL